MLFDVEELVEKTLNLNAEQKKYCPTEFIVDILMEFITTDCSEQYVHFAFKPISRYLRVGKEDELIEKAKEIKKNRSKVNRITAHDSITDATVIFDGVVSEVGGYHLFITPHNKLYDVLRDEPKKLIGRVFLETLDNGVDVQYLKVKNCVPSWVPSKSNKQLLRNLEYKRVTFERITLPLHAAEHIQQYREKYDE